MTIRITSRRNGFRRCGVVHAATPVEYPDDRFSAEELERLIDEPMLIVEVVAGVAEPAAADDAIDPAAIVVDAVVDTSATVDTPAKTKK